MEMSLILTLVVLIVFWIAQGIVSGAPIADEKIKWAIKAIMGVVAIVMILGIWGLNHF